MLYIHFFDIAREKREMRCILSACLSLTRTDVSRPADLDGSGCNSRVEFASRNAGEPAATIIRINYSQTDGVVAPRPSQFAGCNIIW